MIARGLRTVHRAASWAASRWRVASLNARYPGLSITNSTVAPGCEIVCTIGSTLVIDGCAIRRNVTLISDHGASLDVKARYIGPGSVIVARKEVTIGEGTAIGENVVIRDQDHRMPIASQQYETDPIAIGVGAWLAAGCVVLRGSHVGDGATVGANAVVTTNVEPGSLYVGVPATRAR